MFDEWAKESTPKVTVILPTYGYSKYIGESIESILSQTLKEIELIIIEDPKEGKYGSETIVRKYIDDPRVKYLINERREGLVNSLNKGISIAKADYIARQDADDVSLSDRLLRQYAFLKGADAVAVGGRMIVINDIGEAIGYRKYPEIVKSKAMLLRNLVAHPTVMFDKKVVLSLGGYDSEMLYVEDYDLWLRLVDKGYKIYNLSSYIIKYRHHKEAIKYGAFKKSVFNIIKLQFISIRKYKNVGYNVLFPIYFLIEILLLILPKRIGYFLFEKLSVKSSC